MKKKIEIFFKLFFFFLITIIDACEINILVITDRIFTKTNTFYSLLLTCYAHSRSLNFFVTIIFFFVNLKFTHIYSELDVIRSFFFFFFLTVSVNPEKRKFQIPNEQDAIPRSQRRRLNKVK